MKHPFIQRCTRPDRSDRTLLDVALGGCTAAGRARSLALVGIASLALAGCGLPTFLESAMESPLASTLDSRRLRVERLRENFEGYSSGACLADGDRFGVWDVRFAGYGCVRLDPAEDRGALTLRPHSAAAPEVTHAALVLGPELTGEYLFQVDVRNTEQLRTGSEPNPWEVGWIVWNYIDDEHFYYFIPKPNGWELGKRDPAYPGGQRFLATGDWPVLLSRKWLTVTVHASGGVSSIRMGTADLVHFVDRERPYPAGRLGFYTEDAEVQFARIAVRW